MQSWCSYSICTYESIPPLCVQVIGSDFSHCSRIYIFVQSCSFYDCWCVLFSVISGRESDEWNGFSRGNAIWHLALRLLLLTDRRITTGDVFDIIGDNDLTQIMMDGGGGLKWDDSPDNAYDRRNSGYGGIHVIILVWRHNKRLYSWMFKRQYSWPYICWQY